MIETTYYLDGKAYTFDTQEELDAWLAENPTASKTKKLDKINVPHPTVDQLKDGVSWLQAEGDFVSNMNEWYKSTDIIFEESTAGRDEFTMYDRGTDTRSEPIQIPNAFENTVFSGFQDATSWDNVDVSIKNFFGKDRVVNPKLQEQKEKATEKISESIMDPKFMFEALGSNVDFTWILPEKDGGKGGVGEEDDYAVLASALKEQIGSFSGIFGGSFDTDVDFSEMNEYQVELIIKDAIIKQNEKARAESSEVKKAEFNNSLKEEDITVEELDNQQLQDVINKMSQKELDLMNGKKLLAGLTPGSQEYKNQYKANKKLLNDYNTIFKTYNSFLIDPVSGHSISPKSKAAASAYVYTPEDFEKQEKAIKTTYGDDLELGFKVNGRSKWISDRNGETIFDVTINDPQAKNVLEKLGYTSKGDNKMGYEFEVKLKHLARYYDATVKSDGFTFGPNAVFNVDKADQDKVGSDVFTFGLADNFTGAFGIADKSSFTSPIGYFGLTEKSGEQKLTQGELMGWFDSDEYLRGDDLSKGFKRLLKDYRTDRYNIVKEGEVLKKMHLLNLDVADATSILPTRGAELIVEGFKGMFGGSQTDIDASFTSIREDKDVLETIANTSNITLTEDQQESVKRSGAYRVYEGVTGFVPAIAEFALIDLAIKKGAGIVPGLAKLGATFSKGTALQKTAYHTFMAVKEEFKMAQAFDEHYHMGGGTGFYAIGTALPRWTTGFNQFNTFLRANRSGFAGALSTQGAANLEAMVRDLKGNETYKSFITENYKDLNLKFEDFIIDYAVFTMIGAKGWAFQGGKNNLNAFKTTERLRAIETELVNKMKSLEADIKGGVFSRAEKEIKSKEYAKASELFFGIHKTLENIYKVADWQNPEKATELLNRSATNLKEVFGKDVTLKAVNSRKDKDGKELFDFSDSAAEFSKDGKTILVDVNRVEAGKMPHEVFHLAMRDLFKGNPEMANQFKATIESTFKGNFFTDVVIKDKSLGEIGKKRNMTIEEFIMNEHGKQKNFDDIKAEEFLAYTAEILSNPRYYSQFVAKGTWSKLKVNINGFTNRRLGLNVFDRGTKQDLIDFMANFSKSVRTGNLTRKQVNMFESIKTERVFEENIDADMRTVTRINEQRSEKAVEKGMPSKSVELSEATQQQYNKIVKGKQGGDLNRAVNDLIKPDPKNPNTSVAGKNFDNIIYDLIETMYPEVYRNTSQRYTLALEMVYDLNSTQTSKNRGVPGIVKDYVARKDYGTTVKEKADGTTEKRADIFDSEGNKRLSKKQVEGLESKYNAKFGTPEFVEQANAEGYKGKQNLTKTVREMLINRIHKMKSNALGKESEFENIGYTESIEERQATGRDIVDTSTKEFEFKSQEDIKKEAAGKPKTNVLDYVPAKDLVGIRENTTQILLNTKSLNDLRPAEIIKKISEKSYNIVDKQLGRVKEVKDKDGNVSYEKVAKKDYYDIQKEIFQRKEKLMYEAGLLENRDRSTSETTNFAKTAFGSLYKLSGEFTFKDLNKGLAKELLTDSQKAEGRKIFSKEPYKAGILNNIVFQGTRKDQHHKKIDVIRKGLAFTLVDRVLNNQLNNPRFVEMLKEMNPGVYEGLKLDNVLNSVRENIRGTISENLASKKQELLVDAFANKIKKGQGARNAILETIVENPWLEPYKKEILDKMNIKLDDFIETGEVFMKVGESDRVIGVVKGKGIKPVIFEKKFVDVRKELMKIAEQDGLNKDLLNINETVVQREADALFQQGFHELFLPKLFNSFDARLLNLKGPDRGGLGTTTGYGNQRPGFRELENYYKKVKDGAGNVVKDSDGNAVREYVGKRPKIYDADMRAVFFAGLKGTNEKLPKGLNPKYVKVNENTDVQKITHEALGMPEFSQASNPANIKARKKLANYVKKQLSPDGTLKGYDKMLVANEKMLEYISSKVFDYYNKSTNKEQAINNLSYFFQIQSNLGKGFFRGLASHNAITLNKSIATELSLSKQYRSEHEFQLVNFTGNLLINALTSKNSKQFKSLTNPLIKIYKQSIINKELQERIDNVESGGNTANVLSKKGALAEGLGAKANFLLEREIMESILDLKSGKTYAEIIDGKLQSGAVYKKLQTISAKANLPSKNISPTGMIRNAKIRDKAIEEGNKRNKKARGMSTFDFDETVGISNNFVIAKKGGKTKKIASNEWPFVGDKMIEEGWKMDFTDFNRVTDGKPGPLMQKLKNQIKKFGSQNVFILTARAPESQKAIHDYLISEGVKLPIENITGLGNSTGEAKAMWMLEKFSEGYNDMYFVDDAMPNVKAVKEVLEQLDIKSKVQQALASKNVGFEINKMMEHSLGVESNKVFSKAEAKVRGKDIKRRRVFMRDSAADLELLIEPLYGKGKKGNENKKWFKKEFIMPFETGIRDYNSARQSAKNDYMSLRKENKDVVKVISKEVEGTSFTNDMAMRVYLWSKSGYKIPDLAKTTESKLVEHVMNNPKLQAYAERFATITKQEKGLKEPGENWWAETMAGEVTNIDRGVSRKQYLQQFIDVKNEIFSEVNLNKMESKLGTRWRENIEDMFDRMETGRTRSLKLDRGSSAMMNYLNGGIGTIMNFNTRSAALQTISTLNFLNMRENNPISAAKAMGNIPQFAKDFKFIMNSDMLKQRRDGLAINVTEAEIASAAASSPNMIQGIISKVLKVGYTPTKLADSFAISFGGATFYRNRIKMYEKQGMETKAAEKQAFLDFQVLAERTQQSSRADLLSRQQTSLIGRIILPFANTPMQMNRAGMKDILDIAKGRTKGLRNTSEAIGRISYYMGAQVAMFAGLQSALFAMLFNDEDVTEEKIASTKTYTLQSTADSMLRGFGVQGALISSFKNATLEFFKQNAKPAFKADYSEVAEDFLNLSPPIGSKFGMLDAAGDRLKFNKDVPFEFKLGNPKLESSLMTIQALSNAPVYSPYQNITNMQKALSDQHETWQRILMGAGWTPFNVGIEQEKKKKKKSTKFTKYTF